jgi:multiple sugar transport system substrate-binding protein
MARIEFSSIGEPAETVRAAIKRFEEETHNTVQVRVMQWEYAWPELLSYALHGNGPDISHVGSTWVGSLVKMNALRPFTPEEVKAVGGAKAFLPACWNSVVMPGDDAVWALPWTSYTFLIAYRRDILARAGVEEASAFSTAQALKETLRKLRAANIVLPWSLPTGRPHVDTLHMVASWVWGAGGDFIAADGQRLLFNHAKSLAGLQAYFELHEFIPRLARNLTPEQVPALFRGGEAAITICGIDEPYSILRSDVAVPAVRDNLGIAAIPGQPWVGGDHLVIWRHASYDPASEKAAVSLAGYLVSQEAQSAYCRDLEFAGPTSLNALPDLPFPESQITTQVRKSLLEGRSYHPVALWGRIETQLSSALNHIWLEIFDGMPVDRAIKHQLGAVARRLETALIT